MSDAHVENEAAAQAENPAYVRPKDIDNRSTRVQRMLWAIETFAWDWIYWTPFKAMSIERASAIGASILRTLGPRTSKQKVVVRNLKLAFPEWDDDRIQTVARETWDNLGRIVGEMPHLGAFRPELGRVDVVHPEKLLPLKHKGVGSVFISGHLSNWELFSAVLNHHVPDLQLTHRAANNPGVDQRINAARMQLGAAPYSPKGIGTRDLMRALASGRSVALMNDQKFNQGLAVPFFGHEAMTAPGPTRLALKYGAPIVPMSNKRIGPARYRVEVHDPIWPDASKPTDEALYDSLLQINQFMEARIREAPAEWFWMHNRWPKGLWAKP